MHRLLSLGLIVAATGCLTNPVGEPFDPFAEDGCPDAVRELLWWPTGLFDRLDGERFIDAGVTTRQADAALAPSPVNWTGYHVTSLAWAMPAPDGRVIHNEFRVTPGTIHADLDAQFDPLDIRDAFRDLANAVAPGAGFRMVNDWYGAFDNSRRAIETPFDAPGADDSGSQWGRAANRYHVDVGDAINATALVATLLPAAPSRAAFPLPQSNTYVDAGAWTVGLGLATKTLRGERDLGGEWTLTVDGIDQARLRSSVPLEPLALVAIMDRLLIQADLPAPDLQEVAFDRRACPDLAREPVTLGGT